MTKTFSQVVEAAVFACTEQLQRSGTTHASTRLIRAHCRAVIFDDTGETNPPLSILGPVVDAVTERLAEIESNRHA